MSTLSREGLRAIQASAKLYLEMRGYEIIEQNWHQSRYKVDIIAKKAGKLYFVEVRHGLNDHKTVASTLSKQLRRAAEAWVGENKWTNDYALAVVEVDVQSLAVLNFIDNEL